MYVSAIGSAFFIGAARPTWEASIVTDEDFTAEAWIEVGGVSSLGRVSGEWKLNEETMPACDAASSGLLIDVQKVVRPSKSMQVIVGVDTADAGQAAMIAAEDDVSAYPFRFDLPNGEQRKFVALVIGMEDAIEDGTAAICYAFSLRLQSNLLRIQGAV